MDDSITIAFESRDILSGICGANDGNLRIIEGLLGGSITARGNEIHFESRKEGEVRHFKAIMDSLVTAVEKGEEPSGDYVRSLAEHITFAEHVPLAEYSASSGEFAPYEKPRHGSLLEKGEKASALFRDLMINIPHGLRQVYPRTKNQALYIKGMRENEICFCVGPAGTGKTYLAIAHALQMTLTKKMRKIVLTRPVVEAGENLGFLPGDLSQKIDPYLRPLYDAMDALIPYESIRRLEETRSIEIAPLAYMRGRSLNDCIVILDEAQNTTKEQMKMFLTRIGGGARAVITGDSTQIDLPRKTDSGLLHAVEILRNIEGLHFSFLHTTDVARNPLIKKIIKAYEDEA